MPWVYGKGCPNLSHPPALISPPTSASSARYWPSPWCDFVAALPRNSQPTPQTERLRYTSPPTRAVMPTPIVGEPHDRNTHHQRHPARGRAGPHRRPEDGDHARAEGAVAHVVRQGAATGQPALP